MNEDFHAELVNSARDSIIVIDDQEKVVFWNQAAVTEFGFLEHEAIGRNLHQLIMPSTYQNAHKEAAKKSQEVANKSSRLVEVIAKRKDGSEVPVEISLSFITIDGQWLAVGFIRNISLRRKRDEQIRKLSGAVEQSPSTLVITDKQGSIEYCNPKFTQISGYDLAEIVGKNPNILKSGKQPETVYQDLWETVQAGNEWRGELLNKKKSGELYWEFASISPLRNAAGEVTHYLKVAEEITERKRVEQALHEAKKAAEKASEAKSEFLANMSHEIRTPMNVIIGMTDHILDTGIESKQREYVSMVNDSAKLLLNIINQILDFSKVEAGKLELKMDHFDIKVTIERLMKILETSAKERGLNLQLEYGNGMPDIVVGDPVRLQQVLINLIGNAIKFTDVGEVTVSVTVVEQDENQARIAISVKDTGIGIAEEERSRLFLSFSQIDGSLARQYEGTGLGLAISKKLVELMGGTIDVESELGKGSNFYFDVAYRKADEVGVREYMQKTNADTSETVINHIQGRVNILLAEDKKMNQILAKTILEKKGWRVTIASNGSSVLKAIEEDIFDIILMDIQMPEMDGLEATQVIRSMTDNPNRTIPIIAMTANAMDGDREKYLQKGMDDYIGKPFNAKELYDLISKHLTIKEEIRTPRGLREGLRSMNNDKELYKEIVDIFIEEYPKDIQTLKDAVALRDHKRITEVAHGLKGELGNLRAQKAYDIVCDIERLEKENYVSNIDTLCIELEQELMHLDTFFRLHNWIERL